MCRRLLWGWPLLALALGVSPAPAWHPHHPAVAVPVAPTGYAVQSYAVPSAYTVPAMSYAVPATSYAVPAMSYAVPATSYAAPASSYTVQATSFAAPVTRYSVVAPSGMVLTQAAPGGNAQAQTADLLTLIDTIRKITDALGGIRGGNPGTDTQLSAQVAKLARTSTSHEARIQAIEKKLNLQKKPASGKTTSDLRQFYPSAEEAPDAEAEGVPDGATPGGADPIQKLIQSMDALQRATAAQQQAATAAVPAIDYRIAVLQKSIDDLTRLRKQLQGLPAPPPEKIKDMPRNPG